MVFVDDVAYAMLIAAQSELSGFNCFNVASGQSISNNDILKLLRNSVGDFQCDNAHERPGDVRHTLSSIDKIKTELNWSPMYNFETGMNETLEWWGLIDES